MREVPRGPAGKNPPCNARESESRSVVSDSVTPWTIQPMEFSSPEYWSNAGAQVQSLVGELRSHEPQLRPYAAKYINVYK